MSALRKKQSKIAFISCVFVLVGLLSNVCAADEAVYNEYAAYPDYGLTEKATPNVIGPGLSVSCYYGMNFGSLIVQAGKSAVGSCILTNTDAADMTFGQITPIAGTDFTVPASGDGCSGKTLATAASCSIDVKFAPQHRGPCIDAVQVPSDAPDPSDPAKTRTDLISVAGNGAISRFGTFEGGVWDLDYNASRVWESSEDVSFGFGSLADVPVMGDWTGKGSSCAGVFRTSSDRGKFILDINCNNAYDDGDRLIGFGLAGDTPVVGDWNGDGRVEIGVKRGRNWYLDYNGNAYWDGCGTTPDKDRCYAFGIASDEPVAGDWTRSGYDSIGVFRNGVWYLDYTGEGRWDGCGTTPDKDRCYAFGAVGDRPLVGDWNGDLFDDFGVFRSAEGKFFIDLNGDLCWNGQPTDGTYSFGLQDDRPVVYDFDPSTIKINEIGPSSGSAGLPYTGSFRVMGGVYPYNINDADIILPPGLVVTGKDLKTGIVLISSGSLPYYGGSGLNINVRASDSFGKVSNSTVPLGSMAPLLVWSPTARDFGPVAVGSSSIQNFTVKNSVTAQGKLKISSISVGGLNPSEFVIQNNSCTPDKILDPAGSCSFDIKFSPTSGFKSAKIVITSNDPRYPSQSPLNVSLSGTGSQNFVVSAAAGANGNLDASTPSPATVAGGATKSFKFTADTGYHVATVTDTCGGAGYTNALNTVSSYTYTTPPVTKNCSVNATFALNSYSVTSAVIGGGGTVSCTPAVVNYGGSFTCTITPSAGYVLKMITDNDVDVTTAVSSNKFTRSSVWQDHSIVVTFNGQSSSLTYKEVKLSMLSPGVYRADVLFEEIGAKPAQNFYKVIVPPECKISVQLSASGVISASGYSNVNVLYSVVPSTSTSKALEIYNEMLKYWNDNSIQGNLGRVSPIDGNTYWYKFTNDPETEILDLYAPLSSVYYMQVVNESQAGKYHVRVGCY